MKVSYPSVWSGLLTIFLTTPSSAESCLLERVARLARQDQCGVGEKWFKQCGPCVSSYMVEFVTCIENTNKDVEFEIFKGAKEGSNRVVVKVDAAAAAKLPKKSVDADASIGLERGATAKAITEISRKYFPRGENCSNVVRDALGAVERARQTATTALPPASTVAPAPSPSTAPAPVCPLGKFQDGQCLPPIGSKNLPPEMMLKLFVRCNQLAKGDEYTSVCCEHLSPDIAKQRRVCGQ